MGNKKTMVIEAVTYLAQLGVGAGTTGACSIATYKAFGKTKLGKVFAFTTSVCAGVCTAFGADAILRSGAGYTVNTLADAAEKICELVEFRREDIQETQEDEAN